METISDVCSNSSRLILSLSETCLRFIYTLQVMFPRINPITAFSRLWCSSCPIPSSPTHKQRLVQKKKTRLMPRRVPSPLSSTANSWGRCRWRISRATWILWLQAVWHPQMSRSIYPARLRSSTYFLKSIFSTWQTASLSTAVHWLPAHTVWTLR